MKTKNKRKKVQKRIQKGGNLLVYLRRLYEDFLKGHLTPDQFFEQARERFTEDANMNAVKQIKNAEDAINRTRKKCEKAERKYETLLEKIEIERAQKLESARNYGENYKHLDADSVQEEIERIIGEVADEDDIVSVVNPYLFDTGEFAVRPNAFDRLKRIFKYPKY